MRKPAQAARAGVPADPPGALEARASRVLTPSRPRVRELLAAAWERRVTLVVAGGGYGKTTALRELASAGRVAWLGVGAADREVGLLADRVARALGPGADSAPPFTATTIGAEDHQALAEAEATRLCERFADSDEEMLLVLDDVEELGDEGAAVQFLRTLCLQAPVRLHVVLSGRRLPSLGLGRSGSADELLEITAPDLAFTLEEARALLEARLDDVNDGLAERCLALTGGWPAAVALIADRLVRVDPPRRERTLAKLRSLGGQLWREFVVDLIDREAPDARRTLSAAAVAPIVDTPLLDGLGIAGAAALLDGLQSRGLLVAAGEDDGRAMSPVLSTVLVEELAPSEAAALREQAGSWLESAGRLEEALECRLGGAGPDSLAFLERCGHELVARGYGARVAEILGGSGEDATPALDAVLGEALQSCGEWDGAIETFSRVQRATEGPLPAGIAWRFGALLYLRGESEAAVAVLSPAQVSDGGSADDALVSAWLSSTLWSQGEPERAAQAASTALAQAAQSGDRRALAAAHVAAALDAASSGDRGRNESHYRAALTAAVQAGDSMQLARIRANLSSKALEEGDYAQAIVEADLALSVGAGHRFFAALALCNKAEALLRLGELDAAGATLLEALEGYSMLGSLMAGAPHTLLGELYRERGNPARARVSFEQGRRLAEQGRDAHTLVHALCGLARTLTDDDPESARRYAQQALERASSLERAQALCSSAWVELGARDLESAAERARQAQAEALQTADRPALAEALAIEGIACEPPRPDLLGAAIELWDEVGNTIAVRRVELVLAASRGDRRTAEKLRGELAGRGVAPGIGASMRAGPAPMHELVITTLGRFAVLRDGEPVASAAWQSRKARDLLKLLVGRRGGAITREGAAEALWPGEPAGALSNRLSVALSTLRRVLDPQRTHAPDHFVSADSQTLTLRVEHVAIDVVAFLSAAAEGVALAAAGEDRPAEAKLREAENLYGGEFLEEDLYEDWAVDCREAARSQALEVSRLLARSAAKRGDDEAASRHLRRLLERDPYDENAWIALIGAQSRLRRYGEARRQHALYARRMAELDVDPVALAHATGVRP